MRQSPEFNRSNIVTNIQDSNRTGPGSRSFPAVKIIHQAKDPLNISNAQSLPPFQLSTVVQLKRGHIRFQEGAEDKQFKDGEEVEILETDETRYRVRRMSDKESEGVWISQEMVVIAEEKPGNISVLLSKLQGAMEFVRSKSSEDISTLIAQISADPRNLDELDIFAKTANKAYEAFDHKIKEEIDDEMSPYRERLVMWMAELQQLVYALRDSLLLDSPEQLSRFSLSHQYKVMHPDKDIPEALSEIDKEMGVIIFSTQVENDCGRFANKLYEERRRNILTRFLKEKEETEKKEEDDETVLNFPGVSTTKYAKLEYVEDVTFPYPHHAKTGIAEIEGSIFSLEAHKGKPFLLAPELREFKEGDGFSPQENFLEFNDKYIAKRTTHSIKSELEQTKSREGYIKGYTQVNPFTLGTTPEKMKEEQEKKQKQLALAKEPDYIKYWRVDLRGMDINDIEKQDEIIKYLLVICKREGKEDAPEELSTWSIYEQWITGTGLDSTFSEEKFNEWVKRENL
ncbi:hypothetical protein [Chitinophaga tropicalis]|uniref:Uncharacterized protein n=1 Tax=Chitinophaga tropicalis TaxID=2683588 RepID=A0A7K1U0X0_9BACT|nr:hypothetical protein [Chitinophaga tropicalis]MVT08014.1 hypothetical protein [Chitinophaga tropicalis]